MIVDDGEFGVTPATHTNPHVPLNAMINEGWLTKHVQLRLFLGTPTPTGLSE